MVGAFVEFSQLLFHLGMIQLSDLTYNTLGAVVSGVIVMYYVGYRYYLKRKVNR